ncbi:MAG: substrate-binding domain-containing protein, partial [Cyanobacteria bacterium P01_C01_bin.73]
TNRWRWLAAIVLLALLGGGLGWWLTRRRLAIANPQSPPQLCCVDEATGVPRGDFTYTIDNASIGDYVFRQRGLVFPQLTVEDAIETAYPDANLSYAPAVSDQAAVAAVLNEQADFALSALYGKRPGAVLPLPPNLQSDAIAYDGIAVFVAFSYARRAQGLPQSLNGRLTLTQLRQLYTGQISNWRQLGGPDLPVRLYVPSEPDMVALFERRVLQDINTISAFRQLVETQGAIASRSFESPDGPSVRVLRTFDSLRSVIQDFEEANIGGIGFGSLSQVFGQCSVYPLALKGESGDFVQALMSDRGGQAIDPTIDLCEDKGSYRRNNDAILTGAYPLAYPIEVIYPYDNSRAPIGRKVVEILQSQESQRLLGRAGLVPIALE